MEKVEEPPLTHDLNEIFLQQLKERRNSLGIEDSKVEVQFEGLSVEAKVHVGLRTPPTLVNVILNVLQDLKASLWPSFSSRKPTKILNGLTGVIRPSRMTIVLGPPSSGKSTFLRALSGKLDPALKIDGKVRFNEQEIKPLTFKQLCSYVSQQDLHHAEMTVRDTLDFSSCMFGTKNAFEILHGVAGRERASTKKLAPEIDALLKAITGRKGSNLTTNYILKLLGLEDCADVIIGDEMRRGISGGQKKRVTIGEMLVSLARSFFMDDISTGLDSSTTYVIIKFLRQMAHVMDITMVISLIQPSPEIFELFDDIILLNQGYIIYQGSREAVPKFFEFMGFKCPERKNIADFLQEVTSRMDQEQYWKNNQREYQYIPVEDFAESFCFYYLETLLEEEHTPTSTAKGGKTLAMSESYIISNWEVLKSCFTRELLLLKRNSLVHIFKNVQIMILAFVAMTLFLRTNMDYHSIIGGNKFLGAIFAAVVIVKFNGMTELQMIVRRLPVFYKQRQLLHLPGWALLFSVYILSLPMSLIETGTWTSLTYFVIGYAPSATRFFQQYIALFCVHQMSMGLFRLIAAIGRTQMMANTLGTAALIAVNIFGGFVISKDDIQPWLLWCYWSSPLTYGQNAVALNEFLDERWGEMFVEEVMSLVELWPLKKAIVGLPGAHGLSAEQRKRLTIAVELVAGPSIIFMDEPTTGLDARAAAIVMRTVRKTVDTGRTVVCTIHQPSTEIFEAFDELLLMKRGGQLIYSGTLGPFSQKLIEYFEAIPGVPKIRKGQNPAGWILDITSSIMEYNLRIDYAGIYHSSSLYRENQEMVEELNKTQQNSEEPHFLTTHYPSFKIQCLACLWKQQRSYWKNPEHNIVRFVTTIITSLLFGVVFWKIGSNPTKEQDIFNILGVMYGSALFLGFTNASIVQPVVATERTVLYRERSAGMYYTVPFAIAQVAVEIPYIIVQVLVFSSVVYPMAGFQFVISKFLWFMLFMLLSFVYFTLYGMMAVALTPMQDIAALLSFLIFIFWNLFSGFIIPRKMIPIWWRWYYWANPTAWTIYGLLVSQLGDRVESIQIPGAADQTIKEFLENYLGLQTSYFPVIVALHLGVIVLFFTFFVIGIKHLNFLKK